MNCVFFFLGILIYLLWKCEEMLVRKSFGGFLEYIFFILVRKSLGVFLIYYFYFVVNFREGVYLCYMSYF